MKIKILIIFLSATFFACQGNKKDNNFEKGTISSEKIKRGAGKIKVEGGFVKTDSVTIHYYHPNNFKKTSPIVFVLPGGGRNGDDYRDSWIKKAEEFGVLVLSPEYNEKYYPEFWNYNLAGMYKDVIINKERTAVESFRISENPKEWIFNDFDRVFQMIKKELDLKTDTYDMFGHSAGGQILHRFAIFHPNNKANRILAANSGWYTLPTDSEDFPYGLKNTVQSTNKVNFNSNLIIFLGEKDDANEHRGSLRRNQEADKQGLHRLARGSYFFDASKETASNLNKDFNWKIEVVNGIGHDYRKMGEAAADYLYKMKQ
jgi:pimeloyl-ACP methyl ester carboxylesterase